MIEIFLPEIFDYVVCFMTSESLILLMYVFQREERKSKSMKKPIGSKELIAELAKNDKKNKKKPKEEDQVEWD